MVRCKVRPDGVEADLELLQEVYEEMRSVQPKGLRYATFQLEDKVTLVSFAERGRLSRRWGRVDLTLRDALASRP
jgi:hypothetical protein